MAKDFNSTTLTFAGNPVGSITGIDVKVAGQSVDVSASDSVRKIYENGLNDIDITIDLKGGTTLARGDVGVLAIVWHDGSAIALPGTCIVTEVDATGRMDDAITSRVTFKANS